MNIIRLIAYISPLKWSIVIGDCQIKLATRMMLIENRSILLKRIQPLSLMLRP